MRHFVHGPDGKLYGPADLATLRQWRDEGRIVPTTLIEEETGGTPFEARRLPGLFGGPIEGAAFPGYPSRQPMPTDADRIAVVAWFCATVSLFLCPLGLGLLAVVLAARARRLGYRRSGLLLVYAVTCLAVGIVLSLLAYRALGLTKD